MRIGRVIFLGLFLGFLLIICVIGFELRFGSIASGQTEIDGLIIEQTQTRIGHEFYRNFVIFWEAPRGIKDYNIIIIEKASPRWGSWIWIEVGGFISRKTVYRVLLKPRTEEIEEKAKKGVGVITEYLRHLQKYEKEVKGQDMTGNGIY